MTAKVALSKGSQKKWKTNEKRNSEQNTTLLHITDRKAYKTKNKSRNYGQRGIPSATKITFLKRGRDKGIFYLPYFEAHN